MVDLERQQSVHNLLKQFHGLEPLKQLFWSELNYQRVNQPLSTGLDLYNLYSNR